MNPNQFTIRSLFKWMVYSTLFWGIVAGTFFEYREMFTGAAIYFMLWVPMLLVTGFFYIIAKSCGHL